MVCTNPSCRKDCPYAESPDPRTFRCYECKLISEMMGNSKAETKPIQGQPRPVKVGDRVVRYQSSRASTPVIYVVSYIGRYWFQLRGTELEPYYEDHCVPGRFPYWEHEDGSPIIAPTK